MKLLCLLALLPFYAAAQPQSTFEKAMKNFQRQYNGNNTDSICNLFHPDWNKSVREGCIWKLRWASGHGVENRGRIKAFRYASTAEDYKGYQSAVFDILFENRKRSQIMFSLKDGKFTSFSMDLVVVKMKTK